VVDNGRGIPVDVKKEFKKSALELVLTTLHAGGKFSSGQYQYPAVCTCGLFGGQCAVRGDGGASAARWCRVEQTYSRGVATSKVTKKGAARGSGTTIFFRPMCRSLASRVLGGDHPFRLDAKTFLHKGLKITFRDEAAGTSDVLEHEGGIADFLAKIIADRASRPPCRRSSTFSARTGAHRMRYAVDRIARGDAAHLCERHPDHPGGTHEQGCAPLSSRPCVRFSTDAGLAPKNLT